jgi:hypothetical protein
MVHFLRISISTLNHTNNCIFYIIITFFYVLLTKPLCSFFFLLVCLFVWVMLKCWDTAQRWKLLLLVFCKSFFIFVLKWRNGFTQRKKSKIFIFLFLCLLKLVFLETHLKLEKVPSLCLWKFPPFCQRK